MEPRYLRIKNWRSHQHYKDRQPPWIKFHWRDLLTDDRFWELGEIEQWQLVRLWGVASNSSRLTVDEDGHQVPVIAYDERALRRLIRSDRKLPLEKFVREGWLIPIAEEELSDTDADASTVLARRYHDASALLDTENLEIHKDLSDAVTSTEDQRTASIRDTIGRSLGEVA
jgi:hypothetical protein